MSFEKIAEKVAVIPPSVLKKISGNFIFLKTSQFSFVAKCCAVFAVAAFLGFGFEAQAKDVRPMSQKLWQNISPEDLEILKQINTAIAEKKHSEAFNLATQLKKDPALQPVPEQTQIIKSKPDFFESAAGIILWNKFVGKIEPKAISFSDISRFSLDNPFFPNSSELNRNVERVAIASNIQYQAGEKYFNSNPAGTLESKLYLLESKINFLARSKAPEAEKEKSRKEIQTLISNIWLKENFSAEGEKSFLQKYQNQLTQIDHINRIDRLLWDGKIDEAKGIMRFVNEDYQALFSAVIEIQNSPKFIDKIVLGVPRKLRSNEGLSYRRVIWYKSKDRVDDLLEVIADLPEKSQFPEKWWSLRRLYSREMIKQKKYKAAYKMIENHSLPTTSSDFWEAEWMSGWIALRFLDKPKDAYARFENLYKNVSQPVTLSRASYWLGMASEGMGDKKKAASWYKTAAKYPIFFYGQLAIHKHRAVDPIQAQEDIILPKDPEITVNDMIQMSASKAAQTAYLLAAMGDKTNAGKIFEWVVNNSKSEGEIAVVMRLINEIGDRQLDAKISRIASKKNVFFIKDKFQIVKEISGDEYAPLIHAIVKQESGFAPTALSHVGAVGFMQLMPDTAKLVAKEVGVPYNRDKLATDIQYNVRLGSHYIKKLIDRFDGSEMLAIASYNAGPNATQRWINEFYDPRKEKDLDMVVDWIELITYSETRNYVQRIMENLIVYKYLMSRANYDAIK
ncbi:MAG: lytic transglycosylase domain-containing protein [Rickettsiales bacterium]|nr:lytic transglycosylase domain-containing protein [Rickettsiales bacterium]